MSAAVGRCCLLLFLFMCLCVYVGGVGRGSLVYVFGGIGKFVVAVYVSKCRLIVRLVNELCCWC